MKIKLILSLLCFMMLSFVLKSQTLDSLLIKAYNNNPELKALQLQYEAALKKAPQVKQLPDPTVGVGVPALRPETRLGAQVLSISASQMFPWFGTLKAKEDVVLTMAKSKYEQVAAERLNIDYQIKTAYFNLYLLQKQQDVIYKDIRIFETLEKVALAKVESGKSLASDVLTVRIKLEELNNKIQILEEQKQYFTAAINEAVNNPASTIILLDTTTVSFADLHYDLEQFKQNIQDNHPLINQLDWNIEASNKELALNAKDRMPSIGLGLDYSMVAKRTDANPQYNGRDILIPKVVVAIPLYQKKYTAKTEGEKLKQEAYNLQKESVTNKMISNIQSYKSEYESAKLMYNLSNKQIEISNSAYDILLAEYSSSGKRFDELMKLQDNINSYEIEILKAIVQSHLSKFKIERLTNF
ncbi:MAG: TolC family protein [Chitinophagales bacterium]|nr:TolC family protein [Chitinophagales bacterium]